MHLPDFVRTPLSFVVVLGVLVFIHEMGHYLAARWVGVHVEAFSIGFGRAILQWTDRVGTVWKLSWIPLGGYVKLHGQERPEDVDEATRAAWFEGRTFHGKSVARRAIVVAAGPIANFLLAAVLFAALFATAGRPVSIPVIGDVQAESAAAQAGLKTGDRVTAIDGQKVSRFEDLQRIIAGAADQTVNVEFERNGSLQAASVHVASREGALGRRMGVLGVRGGAPEYKQLDPGSAIVAGVQQTWDVLVQTLQGLGQMLSGQRSADELSGPLGILQLSGQVASLGIASLVSFIAVLSVNLGLINLFPIPVLDGGHLVLFAIEAIRGRPVPPKVQEFGFRAGFAVLAGLFVFATWNDLSHLGLFHWLKG
ncbi:MAG: RIP metalloprotease RseP [Janthinobacterium lividum]